MFKIIGVLNIVKNVFNIIIIVVFVFFELGFDENDFILN